MAAGTEASLNLIQPFLYSALALLALFQWQKHKDRAARFLSGAFIVLAVFFIGQYWVPVDSERPAIDWVQRAVIALLVFFPYLLYEFMASFVRVAIWFRAAAATLTIALALSALALPNDAGPRSGWVQAWVAVLLLQWVTLLGIVIVRLWSAGKGQPSVTRRRMRTMAFGTAGLAMAAVLEGEFSETTAGGVVQALVFVAALLLMLGFAPPFAIRALWRRNDSGGTRIAEQSLMAATDVAEIAEILLPQALKMLGAKEAALKDAGGEIVAIVSTNADDGPDTPEDGTTGALATHNNANETSVTFPLGSYNLVVVASTFTPFFGHEEIEDLRSFVTLTELALTRNELSEDQSRLAAIVESSDDAILAMTLEGIITSWNRGAEKTYGYRAEEIIGKPLSLLIPPDTPDEILVILEAIRAGTSIEHHETKRLTKDGRTIDVSLTLSPVKDAQERTVGASTIARDISERKQQQELLSSIFEASPDIIATITSSLQLRYVNPAARRILGYGLERLFGDDSFRGVHPEDRVAAMELMRGTFNRSGTTPARLRVKKGDDGWIWLDIRIRRLAETSDLAVVIARDISEQVELEENLRDAKEEADRANLAKSEFLSRMSHELRTPLNAVLGFAQLLEMGDLSEKQRESTEHIIKGGTRLLELINEVLDISRVETGTLRLSLEPVHVGQVVRESANLIKPLADKRGIRLQVDLTRELAESYVSADQQRLGQALLNLLSNAVKYNIDGGRICISVLRADDGGVRIGVTDTGPGIPEERIPLLFTPFERLGAERTPVEGTGLGLALAKHVVEAMGGTVTVDTMMGEGTTFWVDLASTDPPEVSSQASTPDQQRDSVAPAGKILYIEDNLSNLNLIARVLSNRASELIPAMTGALGISLAHEHHPNLILLDLHLPDAQGDEVLTHLRRDPRTMDIPIIIMSADATPGEIKRLKKAGADDYLTKPIDVAGFLDTIDRLLSPGEEA